jgi:hypothetical protein
MAQILWDADSAKWFGELCRRNLRLCEEGKPCPSTPAEGWILLVSSYRGLTGALAKTTSVQMAARSEDALGATEDAKFEPESG